MFSFGDAYHLPRKSRRESRNCTFNYVSLGTGRGAISLVLAAAAAAAAAAAELRLGSLRLWIREPDWPAL